ncbi:helix-turn-helix transcriptional regulator [Streptosporangium sp. NPDC020072]|uniref:helix-turn-helix domain-containing protein n=1 Tax=Streptosporangium sp. NPDC020072 TaxID=3154788 RepID=UPI00344AD8F6
MAFSAERLAMALERKGLSARKAARELRRIRPELRVTHAYISFLANGTRTNPSADVAGALAHLLDVTVDWLLGGQDPPLQAAEDQQHQKVREGLADLGVQHIAERLVGLSPLSLEAVERMVDAMRAAERLDGDPDG